MSQPISAVSATSATCETSEPVQPSPKRLNNATSTKETPHEEDVEQTVLALYDLPLDIIMEILSHTTPEALLVLSRATKFLRSTLMSRSAISVWRGSLASVNRLPRKPSDMTEPQYADLIWGTGCSFCLDIKTVVSSFATRRRYCEKCLEKECYTECNMPCYLEAWVGVQTLSDIIPSVRLGSEYGHNRRYFDRAITDQYETEVITMWGSNDSARLVDLPKWISDKESAHAAVREHARLLESWYRRYKLGRKRDARQASYVVEFSISKI